MSERTETCPCCNREVPQGTSCSRMQAEECLNMTSSSNREDDFLGTVYDGSPEGEGY